MLHTLKFKGRRSLARPLGIWLGESLKRGPLWPLDMVVPLPLHRQREKQRGYNQTYLIAKHTARILGIPLMPLLYKARPTPPQTGLSRRERQNNVDAAFSFEGGSCDYRGASILLMDDIYSTGATLKEGAKVLHNLEATVYGAVAAYNPRLY